MTEAFYIGSEGASPSRFNRPQGVAVDQDGRIIVVDTKNRRLQVSEFV
jgi:tripartite motif-containing protein 71